jgi:hypothetical protein
VKIGRKVLWGLPAVALLAAVALAGWAASGEQESTQASPGFSVGVDVDASGNTATSLGNIETSRTVACGDAFDIDIYVTDVPDLQVWNVAFQYDPGILGVYARDVRMFLAASPGSDVNDYSDGDSGFNGNYDLLARDAANPPAPESGSGVLARLSVRALSPGVTRANAAPVLFFGTSGPISSPSAVDAQITVAGECTTPVPTPTPEPTGTPTRSPTPGTPEPTGTPTRSPTPGTPTPTPPPGTVNLVAGWNDSCYQSSEQEIDDAFAGVTGVQAVYRMKNQTFDRWFPDRPELSTITTLSPFDPLLILMTEDATWTVTPKSDLPHSTPLTSGWNSICYLGAGKDTGAAAAGIMGDFAVIYTLTPDQSWRRFVVGRPEVSNLTRLETFTPLHILVTDPDGALWIFDP